MEKLVFRKFIFDTLSFFVIGTLSLSLIVWVIQAVNYLDFVSEDGHSFKVYFLYTLLNFPKIFSRLFIFMFFISIFYTISRYHEKNELIIFWTNGIRKIDFVNFIVRTSLVLVFVQLILNVFIVPTTQDKARSYIRSSNIDYFPSLIKSKKFINTVEDLTIFIDEKSEKGEMKNIFLKDNNNDKSQIISARKGYLKKNNYNYYLVLEDGNIVDSSKEGSNTISYNQTRINLSEYSTRTTVDAKIQEQNTFLLFKCIYSLYKLKTEFSENNLACNKNTSQIVIEEMYKRIIVPIYIIIVSIVSSCLVLRSENENNFVKFKVFIFFIGIVLIIFSQALSEYLGNLNGINIMLAFFPILLGIFLYYTIQLKIKD